MTPSAAEARDFIGRSEFVWHERFDLVPGVATPGENDIPWLMRRAGIPTDLTGRHVLDIGTSNGGAAFEVERRGAERVVALDIYPSTWFGFDQIKDFLGSRAVHVQASCYDLTGALGGEEFDLVLFWGVLYHLRHPLLGLDNVRAVVAPGGEASIETAVADHELADVAFRPLVRFYRGAELRSDGSNWFAPTTAALLDWCRSAGLEPELVDAWPSGGPTRCLVRATRTPGDPEFVALSYESRLRGVEL